VPLIGLQMTAFRVGLKKIRSTPSGPPVSAARAGRGETAASASAAREHVPAAVAANQQQRELRGGVVVQMAQLTAEQLARPTTG